MRVTLDHIALVVRSMEPVLDRLDARAGEPGPVEEFPGEGTRECYLGPAERGARLLLMEPLGENGPYARALVRRGPGLHHVGLRVPDLQSFPATVPGWLVPPATLADADRTLWLARPNVGVLLEVVEGEACPGAPIVTGVEVPCPADFADRLPPGLAASPDRDTWLTLGGERLRVGDLVAA